MWEKLSILHKLATIAHEIGLLYYLVRFYLPDAENEFYVILFIAIALGQFYLWRWLSTKMVEADYRWLSAKMLEADYRMGDADYSVLFKNGFISIACRLGLVAMLCCLLLGFGIIMVWIVALAMRILILPPLRALDLLLDFLGFPSFPQ